MTTYMVEIKQCQKCTKVFKKLSVGSCNTIGAVKYTDGFMHGLMYDMGCPLVTCPYCMEEFWSEDLLTIAFLDPYEMSNNSEYESVLSAVKIGMYDYEGAMRRGFWKTKSQEKYIRIRAWWSSNHIHRPQASLGVKAELALKEMRRKSIEYPESLPDEPRLREAWDQRRLTEDPENLRKERIANLQKLLELHDTEDTDDIIIRCEILRELEWFDECLKLIKNSFCDEYPQIITVIKKLAEAENNQVALIE